MGTYVLDLKDFDKETKQFAKEIFNKINFDGITEYKLKDMNIVEKNLKVHESKNIVIVKKLRTKEKETFNRLFILNIEQPAFFEIESFGDCRKLMVGLYNPDEKKWIYAWKDDW
ncbi:MAG: hypothetical protein ACTSYF_03390 [Promethearchaeota archaeon]